MESEIRREFIGYLLGDRRRASRIHAFVCVGVILNTALLLYIISKIT